MKPWCRRGHLLKRNTVLDDKGREVCGRCREKMLRSRPARKPTTEPVPPQQKRAKTDRLLDRNEERMRGVEERIERRDRADWNFG